MNQVDAVIVLISGLAAVRGYMRGLLREAFGVVGLVGGIVAGLAFSQPLGDYVVSLGYLMPVEAPLVAAPVIFIGCYLVGTLLGLLAHRLARALLLGWLDRFGGVLFGVGRGLAICALLLALAAHILPAQLLAVVKTSRFGSPLTDVGMRIVDTGRQYAPSGTGGSI